jgi:hypothetical protein
MITALWNCAALVVLAVLLFTPTTEPLGWAHARRLMAYWRIV